MKRIIFFFLLLGVLVGCARAPVREAGGEGKQVIELQSSLAEREDKIVQLEALLNQLQAQLQEKDAQIQSLKDRLAQFGVF